MDDQRVTSLHTRVREAIRRTGRSQRAFATHIDLDPTKLSKSLSGSRRFTATELDRIATACGVSVPWLLHGTDGGHTGPSGPASPLRGTDHALSGTGRRGEIVEVAWQLIAERGYHAVRVSDIARACGTSTATIHYYFPTRTDLLNEALRHCVEQAFDRQGAQLRAIEDGRQRLLKLIDLQLPEPGQVGREWLIWLQFWTETALHPELRAVHDDFYARWREAVVRCVERGIRQGVIRDVDPESVALRFTALTDGLAIQVLTGTRHLPVQTMRRVLVDFVDRELAAR